MQAKITTLKTTEEIALHLVEKLNALLSLKKENVSIAISGGNTPKAIFEHWQSLFADKVNWSRISFFWVDERCVPASSSESNYGVAKQLFFDKVITNQACIYPIIGNNKPDDEVKRLNTLVANVLPLYNNLPVFDLILLGLGTDGHTASIFPSQLHLFTLNEAYTGSINPHSGQHRISLTGKAINNAKERCFVVTGNDKNKIINEILHKTGNWPLYPASYIINTNTEWILQE